MKTYRTMSYCSACSNITPHIKEDHSPNHLLHFFLSCTILWLPVWLLLSIQSAFANSRPPVCEVCGCTLVKASTGSPSKPSHVLRNVGIGFLAFILLGAIGNILNPKSTSPEYTSGPVATPPADHTSTPVISLDILLPLF